MQTTAGPDTGRATGVPKRTRGRAPGVVMVWAAAAITVVAAWWLLAEPVQSPVLWVLDERQNHGVQLADLPAMAAMLFAGWLGVRGLWRWARFRWDLTAAG